MPLMRCKEDGRNGWKYSDSGKCYVGPGAKKKAIRQGIAIQESGGPKFESRKGKGRLTEAEMDVLADEMIDRGEEMRDDAERAVLDKRDAKN